MKVLQIIIVGSLIDCSELDIDIKRLQDQIVLRQAYSVLAWGIPERIRWSVDKGSSSLGGRSFMNYRLPV